MCHLIQLPKSILFVWTSLTAAVAVSVALKNITHKADNVVLNSSSDVSNAVSDGTVLMFTTDHH